ncbi:glutamate synthase-related protein [Streptomyces sp. NPDC002172]
MPPPREPLGRALRPLRLRPPRPLLPLGLGPAHGARTRQLTRGVRQRETPAPASHPEQPAAPEAAQPSTPRRRTHPAHICHTNTCPVGLATQDPLRVSASNVHETSARVHRFQSATAQDHRFAGRM